MPESTAPPLPIGKWFRYRRLPTWRLWLAAIGFFGVLLAGLGSQTHSWLSQDAPEPTPAFLVAEGWMPDYAVGEAGRLFKESKADMILTSGLPVEKGGMLSEHKDYATVSAHTLAVLGVPPKQILPCPTSRTQRERTRVMAEAVRDQLQAFNLTADKKVLNVVSHGVHARRSRGVYQDVLGPEWKVGVHCVPNLDYAQKDWWKSSSGVRGTLTELIAMLVNQK